MKYPLLQTAYKTLFLLISFLVSSNAFSTDYEIVHKLNNENPPGNIAVSKQGRIFMSNHFFYGAKNKIVEVQQDGSTTPYPNAEFSQALNPVLGVVVDKQDILWMLETAAGKDKAGRLIGWNTKKDKLHKIVYIALPTIPENSFLNDLAVDRKNEAIYITDTAAGSNSALIVIDLKSGEARRVLTGSAFTKPENIDMVIDGKTVTLGNEGARIGANPITIDHRNEWVYFAPMTGTKLYRVSTADLLDSTLTETELQKRVEFYAEKPISDGITIDNKNNIYITDITNNAVGYIDTNRNYQILFQDNETLSWADGFSTGTGNSIFVTVNKLHKSPVLNNNKDESGNKYYILKFDALANTSIGR